MDFRVRAARFADGEEIGRLFLRVFEDDDFINRLVRGPSFDEQLAGFLDRWPQFYSCRTNAVIVVEEVYTEEVVSCAVWQFKNSIGSTEMPIPADVPEELHDIVHGPPIPIEGLDYGFRERWIRLITDERRRCLGDQRYLLLTQMATKSKHRNAGAAGKLVRWITQKADELRIACWAEVRRDGRGIMRRNGFTDEGLVVVELYPGVSAPFTGMMRRPGAQGVADPPRLVSTDPRYRTDESQGS